MKLQLLQGSYSISKHSPSKRIEEWMLKGDFFSISRTSEELSIVCPSELVPGKSEHVETGWRAFRVEGPLEFSLTGVLASIANPLANSGVSIFAISTYDTDYVLVKTRELKKTQQALVNAGFEFNW